MASSEKKKSDCFESSVHNNIMIVNKMVFKAACSCRSVSEDLPQATNTLYPWAGQRPCSTHYQPIGSVSPLDL